MVEHIGNSIPAPAYASDGIYTVNDELFYSMVGYTQKGVTLKPGQGVLLLGTGLKKDSSTKYYVKATAAADVEGFLRQTTDTGDSATGQAWQANIVLTGLLKLDRVVAANSGVTLSSVTGATVNQTLGFFKF